MWEIVSLIGTVFVPVSLSRRNANFFALGTGKAVYTLRTTLPNFFETGLGSQVDQDYDLSVVSSRLDTLGTEVHNERLKARRPPESIYAPNIRLTYTPPTALSLPSAFPKTLQVEGEVRFGNIFKLKLMLYQVFHCIMLRRHLLDTH
jgi:hypothetical protein